MNDALQEIAERMMRLLAAAGPLYVIGGAIVLGLALFVVVRLVPQWVIAIGAWHERHRGEVPERTMDDAGDHPPGQGLPPMEVRPDGSIPGVTTGGAKDPTEP